MYAWMGMQVNARENDAGILGVAWRARSRLVKAEQAVGKLQGFEAPQELFREVESVWARQLFAESSDSLGWAPSPGETRLSVLCAEGVLRAVDEIEEKIRAAGSSPPGEHERNNQAGYKASSAARAPFRAGEVYGGDGEVCCIDLREDL